MKFDITINVIPDNWTNEQTTIQFEGELDAAKTFIKLKAAENFNWAAITRTDEDLQPGDVNRWLINQNMYDENFKCVPFSFFGVEPIVNLNAMHNAFSKDSALSKITTYLGGGPF